MDLFVEALVDEWRRFQRWVARSYMEGCLAKAYEEGAINTPQYDALHRVMVKGEEPSRYIFNEVNNWANDLEDFQDPQGTWERVQEIAQRKAKEKE